MLKKYLGVIKYILIVNIFVLMAVSCVTAQTQSGDNIPPIDILKKYTIGSTTLNQVLLDADSGEIVITNNLTYVDTPFLQLHIKHQKDDKLFTLLEFKNSILVRVLNDLESHSLFGNNPIKKEKQCAEKNRSIQALEQSVEKLKIGITTFDEAKIKTECFTGIAVSTSSNMSYVNNKVKNSSSILLRLKLPKPPPSVSGPTHWGSPKPVGKSVATLWFISGKLTQVIKGEAWK